LGLAVRGLSGVLFGAGLIALSANRLPVLTAFLSAYLLASGAFTLVGQKGHSWSLKVGGAVDFLGGLIVFGWLGTRATVPMVPVEAWALLSGLVQIGTAAAWKGRVTHTWPLLLGGVTSIVLVVFLSVYSRLHVASFFFVLGVYILVWGEFGLITAYGLLASRRARIARGLR